MINKVIPITTPNHVFIMNPTHGMTNKDTPVYKGRFTMENGPDVINLCFGTFISINICDQIQFIRPIINTMVEIINTKDDGPPIKKYDGNKMFIMMPTMMIGNIILPVLSPIPINSLMFTSASIENIYVD
ncbi:MAG TPA: hypothetical protein VMT73_03070 [Anaerolineales bacterium]|nr:hypothetical protein [Anaerolineales bacterium]